MTPAPGQPAWDRFTLGDLMATVACFAVGMVAVLTVDRPKSTTPLVSYGLDLNVALVFGGLLAGPVLYLLRRRRPNAPDLTAGEVLWIVNAVVFWVPLACGVGIRLMRVREFPPWWNWLVLIWMLVVLNTELVTLILTPSFFVETFLDEPDPRTCWRRHRLGLYVCATLLLLEAMALATMVVVYLRTGGD
jgi:hypothetical protein